MLPFLSTIRRLREQIAPTKRQLKTPGALYRLLSEEFRAVRCKRCHSTMPPVFAIERRTPEGPNWQVENLWSGCSRCRRYVAVIVERYAARFDVRTGADSPAEPLGAESDKAELVRLI